MPRRPRLLQYRKGWGGQVQRMSLPNQVGVPVEPHAVSGTFPRVRLKGTYILRIFYLILEQIHSLRFDPPG